MVLAQHSSKSNEWYTPAEYVEAAREVMGRINLDPASCAVANRVVGADNYLDAYDDGLRACWFKNIWLNPPYGKTGTTSNQEVWSKKLIEEYESGRVSQAILLVNAATETGWFHRLWKYTLCFTDHRIKFYSPEGEHNQPTHGNVFVYFGPNEERFIEVFGAFGYCIPSGVVRRRGK